MSELSEQNRKLLSAFGVDTPQTVSEFRLMRETMGSLLDAARAEGPAPVSAPLDRVDRMEAYSSAPTPTEGVGETPHPEGGRG